MTATMESINNHPPDSDSSGNIFSNFFGAIVQLCCCADGPLSETQSAGASTRREEELFEINIGEEFANNLAEKFSSSSLVHPQGFQPVVKIPVSLGRKLYAAYVESVFRQQEAHDQIVADLIAEDEEFARQLQEEDRQNEASALVYRQTTAQDERNFKFKKSEELPKVHETGKTKEFSKIPEAIELFDENDMALSATFYREAAQKHHRRRREYYQQAKRYLKAKNRQQANLYFLLAKEQTKLFEQANNFAAATFLAESGSRHPNKDTIDLHHLYVKEAIQALDIFLDDKIVSLQEAGLMTKHLTVVTGRGKHSQDGIPKIKPAVIRRLNERNLTYSEINPGLLKVEVSKNSYPTNDLI